MTNKKTVQHTPGPWATRPTASLGPQYAVYPEADGQSISIVYDHGNTEANARLIAAAPELLNVVEHIEPHNAKVAEKARWLQRWLHESETGKGLPEVDRSSIGQVVSELFQLASGTDLTRKARAAIAKAQGNA